MQLSSGSSSSRRSWTLWFFTICLLLMSAAVPTLLAAEMDQCSRNDKLGAYACTCPMGVFTCAQQMDTFPMDVPSNVYRVSMINRGIKQLHRDSLAAVQYLAILDLGYNRIAQLERDVFSGLRHLRKLYLHYNDIKDIHDDAFSSLAGTLEVLNLEMNELDTLPASLEKLVHLRSLNLFGNPLHCTCTMRYLYANLHFLEPFHRKATCFTPRKYQSVNLAKLGGADDDLLHRVGNLCENSSQAQLSSAEEEQRVMREFQLVGPRSIEATVGDTAWLQCALTGRHPHIRIWWTVPQNATSFLRFLGRNESLYIVEVHPYHAGVYTCHSELLLSRGQPPVQQSRSAVLTLINRQRPQIIVRPGDLEVQEGSEVVLRCEATGYPPPLIQWLFQTKKQTVQLTSNGDFVVLDNQLIIFNVTLAKSTGEYLCYASNPAGSSKVRGFLRVVSQEAVMQKQNKEKHAGDMNANGADGKMVDEFSPLGQSSKNLSTAELVERAILRARKRVEEAIKKTADRLSSGGRTRQDIQTLFRQPNKAAVELSKAAEVYEAALEEIASILRQHSASFNLTQDPTGGSAIRSLLTDEQLAIVSQLSGCQSDQTQEEASCELQLCFHLKYRSVDGRCNNLQKPRQGAALSPLKRLLPPEYENGVNTPIGWNADRLYFGYPKPSARDVSTRLISTYDELTRDPVNSAMLMQWGQFLDHDLDFTPADPSNSRFSDGLACNETCVNDPPCFPILVSRQDPRVRRHCMGFSRSIPTCGSGSTSILLGRPYHREQVNQITSYLDGSNVYASEQFESDLLKETEIENGRLREGPPTFSGKRLLPFVNEGQIDCQIDPNAPGVACFKAGDHRSNENIGLTIMHTMWMREHNRIVEQLQRLNPHWTGDKLYFEARQIVGAEMQHITMEHWLPYILGEEGMRMITPYNGYDDRVDASISNVFSTAAFRFGHTLINPLFFRFNASWQPAPEGHVELPRAFFAPHLLFEDGGMDPFVRGLLVAGIKMTTPLQPMNYFLTESLFKFAHDVPQDLAALNIQRGRDHGLPSYNAWRRYCGLPEFHNFEDAPHWKRMPEKLIGLKTLYGHPGNVDLFPGAVLEELVPGGRVGPTFRCIIAEQFSRTRAGDRFWYENPGAFTTAQLTQLRHASLARIVCDNSDNITAVPMADAFLKPTLEDDGRLSLVDCTNIPEVNLLPWKECPLGCGQQSTAQEQVPIQPVSRTASVMGNAVEGEDLEELKGMVEKLQKRLLDLEHTIRTP